MGTHESLVEATNFLKTVGDTSITKIACLEGDRIPADGQITRHRVLKLPGTEKCAAKC